MNTRIIVIGTSLGGLNALKIVLGGLPAALGAAIAVVQHRMADPRSQLQVILRRNCALPVREPCDKEPIVPGRIYVAPADYHLLIEDGTFALTTDGPVSYARPSIDVLFETAAEALGRNVIGVVLTGANYDGAKGAAAVKTQGRNPRCAVARRSRVRDDARSRHPRRHARLRAALSRHSPAVGPPMSCRVGATSCLFPKPHCPNHKRNPK